MPPLLLISISRGFNVCFVPRIFRTVSFLRSIDGSRSRTRMPSTRNSDTESRERFRDPSVISEVNSAVHSSSSKIRRSLRTCIRVAWTESMGSGVLTTVSPAGMISDPLFTTHTGISESGVRESRTTREYFPMRISFSISLCTVCFSKSRYKNFS